MRRDTGETSLFTSSTGYTQLAGLDQAHEQMADRGTVKGAIKQGIPSMKNCLLQSSFYEVMPTPVSATVETVAAEHC